jgi:hypothetical protein
MTLATLDEMLSDEHSLELYGYREEELRGGRRYVGRDSNGRAVIGPRRHRAKGLMSLGRSKKKAASLPVQERTMKIVIDPEAVARATAGANRAAAQMAEDLKTVDFSKLGAAPPPPQEKPSMFAGIRNWCTEKWYDEEWHQGARNTAGTLLLWGFVVFAMATFARGLAWVLFGV